MFFAQLSLGQSSPRLGGKTYGGDGPPRPELIDRATLGGLGNRRIDMNGVAVARHGLILSQDGATASRMLFKGLWGLFYLIFGLKI